MKNSCPSRRTLTRPLIGILYMLGMAFLSAAMNSAARHITDTIHPFEIVFFRNLFGSLFVLPIIIRYGFSILKTQRFSTHLGRAGLNVINHLFFFTALSLTTLSELVALGFTAPIFTTMLAVILFGEIVGWRRWGAIIFAFFGTLIILKPGIDNITLGHGITLMAALTWAGVLLFIKSLSDTERSITIVAYATFLMTPLSLIPALFVWQWPTYNELMWLAFIGLTAGCAQFFIAQALHETDLNVVMPFDFTKLIWVSVIAFLFFGEIPELTTWIGGAFIFSAGIYVAHREAAKNPKTGS